VDAAVGQTFDVLGRQIADGSGSGQDGEEEKKTSGAPREEAERDR